MHGAKCWLKHWRYAQSAGSLRTYCTDSETSDSFVLYLSYITPDSCWGFAAYSEEVIRAVWSNIHCNKYTSISLLSPPSFHKTLVLFCSWTLHRNKNTSIAQSPPNVTVKTTKVFHAKLRFGNSTFIEFEQIESHFMVQLLLPPVFLLELYPELYLYLV